MNTNNDTKAKAHEIARSLYSPSVVEEMFAECLRILLNSKSLYQSVSIDDNELRKRFLGEQAKLYDDKTTNEILRYLRYWISKTTYLYNTYVCEPDEAYYHVHQPRTVKTYCSICKAVTTHNPEECGDCYRVMRNKNVCENTFHVEYACQDCKEANVSFLVMRKGLKFQIMGRSPIEVAAVSNEVASQLNEEEIGLFGEALIASKTGSELAAICLLRVALESYLRRITGNKVTGRLVSGEELYEQYKKRLPDDFPFGRVESLGKIYNDLSAVMHTAIAPEGCFIENYGKIESFFKFLTLMPLKTDIR